jgi:hypothetical protein
VDKNFDKRESSDFALNPVIPRFVFLSFPTHELLKLPGLRDRSIPRLIKGQVNPRTPRVKGQVNRSIPGLIKGQVKSDPLDKGTRDRSNVGPRDRSNSRWRRCFLSRAK